MGKSELREQIINTSIESIKELGYLGVNKDNIFTNTKYSKVFLDILMDMMFEYPKDIDNIIFNLIHEIFDISIKNKDKEEITHLTKNSIKDNDDLNPLCDKSNDSEICIDNIDLLNDVSCPKCLSIFNKAYEDSLIIKYEDINPIINPVNNESEIKMIIDFINNSVVEDIKNSNFFGSKEEAEEEAEDMRISLLKDSVNKRNILSIKCYDSNIYQVTEQVEVECKNGNKSIDTIIIFIMIKDGKLRIIEEVMLYSGFKDNYDKSEINNLNKLLKIELDNENYLEAGRIHKKIKEIEDKRNSK